jgi:hypothetical protein
LFRVKAFEQGGDGSLRGRHFRHALIVESYKRMARTDG